MRIGFHDHLPVLPFSAVCSSTVIDDPTVAQLLLTGQSTHRGIIGSWSRMGVGHFHEKTGHRVSYNLGKVDFRHDVR
jgi:hypothetical protein